jgi:predicted PurR-regulated permease PerM
MNTKLQTYFFFTLCTIALILVVFIFLPFLTPCLLAALGSVIFQPLHRLVSRFISRGRENNSLSSLITICIVIVVVLVPIFFLGSQLYQETKNLYSSLVDESGRAQAISGLNTITSAFSERFLGFQSTLSFESFNVVEYAEKALSWIFSHLNSVFSSAAKIMLDAFIFLFALFYLLRDGAMFKKRLLSWSPLPDVADEQVLNKLQQAVRSIVSGTLIIGIIQGMLTGIGFALCGIPNAALWGCIAAIVALIPAIGTSLVLIPGILYLFITGNQPGAIGLALWGVVAVGLVDNVLGPRFMNRGLNIHPLLTFLAALGGIIFFGPIGFIMGPLALAFLVALLEIHDLKVTGVK